MREKDINGPIAIGGIALAVLLIGGLLYFFLNKDSLGAKGQPKPYSMPGQIPQGARTDIGPFPSTTRPDGRQMTGMPGVSPPGATAAGK